MSYGRQLSEEPTRVPKVLGADVELGNFIDGVVSATGSGRIASRLLLEQIPGVLASGGIATSGMEPPAAVPYPSEAPDTQVRYVSGVQDWGRRFLASNGGCCYVDLDHLELALPETLSAFDHVACWRAMLHVAREATRRVNRALPDGLRVHALANCSDGHGQSYGAHMNVLLTRRAWDNLMHRKPHYLAFLAAFQVSSVVITGSGKVGSENGRPWADYQLTTRGDFLETVASEPTTYRRGLVNTRDEPLCAEHVTRAAGDAALARLHVTFFDPTLCQVATLLRVGTMQIVTAMIEAGRVHTALALDDPLDALQRWGHDPSLRARARLVDGQAVTAVEMQLRFLEEARRFGWDRGFDGIVPHAARILDLWEDTLVKLRDGDFVSLARRLDWVLKRQILERAMAMRPSLSSSSAEIKHLDQMYSSVDPADGLFWAHEEAGCVDVVVDADRIRRAAEEPPEDTRAWTRAQLLRRAHLTIIDQADWDRVGFRVWHSHWSAERQTVYLPCPFGATKTQNEALFAPDTSLADIVEALGGTSTPLVIGNPSPYRVC